MNRMIVALALTAGLFIASCKGNDTTTQMPNDGYKERTDSTVMPEALQEAPRGAVAVDSVKNGQFNVSGIPDSSIKKKDSAAHK